MKKHIINRKKEFLLGNEKKYGESDKRIATIKGNIHNLSL